MLCESSFFSRLVEFREDFSRFARYSSHPILNMSNARDWGAFWEILGERADLLGNVALNLGARSHPAPTPAMRDPAISLGFFARELAVARLPTLSRHPLAAAARLNGKK